MPPLVVSEQGMQKLTPYDSEFGKMEYLVKLGLRSTSVNIISVLRVNNSTTISRFEHTHQNSTVLDSFININEISEINSVRNIVHRGGRIVFTEQEPLMMFPVGNIRLPTSSDSAGSAIKDKIHELLYCRVAVGHALVLERGKINLNETSVPAGYDSIKLHTADDDDSDIENPDYYYHEYLLGDDHKVLPMFLVAFTFDPDADKCKRNPLCEQCERNPASFYCIQDNAKLCDQCDLELHCKSKLLEKHKRVSISEVQGNLTLSRCKEHPEMPIQFFDTITLQPVCVHCRVLGSHSSGENMHHPLMAINDAYTENMLQLHQEREVINHKQNRIRTQLRNIDDRVRKVHANTNAVEKQLRTIINRVIERLQRETQSKLHLLLSDEAELRRQLHHYEWIDAFYKYQKDVDDPVEFLSSFRYYVGLLRNTPNEILETSPSVMEDIVIEGGLDIRSIVVPGGSYTPHDPSIYA